MSCYAGEPQWNALNSDITLQVCGVVGSNASYGKVLRQNSIKIHCSNTRVFSAHKRECSIQINNPIVKLLWMKLIDFLTVCGEKTDTKCESDYFQLVWRQFLTNQNEFNIYIWRRVSAENAKNPALIGYYVHELQHLKYRSASERHEILCVQTLKLIICMT